MSVTNTFTVGSPTEFSFTDGDFQNFLGSIDLTTLADGTIAFAGDHIIEGHVDIGVGSGTDAFETDLQSGSNAAIDQLKSGRLAAVSQDAGDIVWSLYDSSGVSTGLTGDLGVSNSSNADVVGLTGGRFVIGYQRNFGGTDNDIKIDIRSPNGAAITNFSVSGSTDNDENVSLAALRDGGFAVTWDRNNAGTTQAWFAIYNSDGTVRVAPHASDSSGNHNSAVSAVGMSNGGFAVAYVDNGWTGEDQITVAIYNANGQLQSWTNAASALTGHPASEPSLTELPDGTLAVSWTQQFNASDNDIYMQLIDPKTGATLLASPAGISTSTDNQHASSITALGDGQVLVGWYDDSLGTEGKTLQLFVERDGDEAKNHIFGSGAFDTIKGFGASDMLKGGGGDDTINGGDGKDSINGQLGSDLLIGGAGKDLFQFSDIADVRYGDTIQDLDAKDRINLAGIDADANTAGNQSFTIVSAFTGAAGQMTIDYNVTHAGMTTLQMDVDGDGLSDGSIMIVGDHTGFTNYVL